MYTRCIICENEPKKVIKNHLSMYECFFCGLLWRTDFDISIGHYEDKEIDLGSAKVEERLANCNERIKTIAPYANLERVCDIGCGEGLFLQALKNNGYANGWGIEPSAQIDTFVDSHGLTIYKGTIDDAPRYIKEYGATTVTLFHVIEHLPKPHEALKVLYDALHSGSTIVLETPNIFSYSLIQSGYQHKLIYPEHLFYFSQEALSKLLKKIGFTVVAAGKRDFHETYLGIHEALFRLGLRQKPTKSSLGKNSSIQIKKKREAQKNTPFSLIKYFLRRTINFILSTIVRISGRQDYQWIVVKK